MRYHAKTAFVTSRRYGVGDMGSLAGADAICQIAAQNADLQGEFRAWLSHRATDAASRFNRDHDEVPFVLVNGDRIANSWTDLTNGRIQRNLNVNEFGSPILENTYASTVVWTGTSAGGLYVGPDDGNHQDCNSWSSPSSDTLGRQGNILERNGRWSNFENRGCHGQKRLYCCQQVSPTNTKIYGIETNSICFI